MMRMNDVGPQEDQHVHTHTHEELGGGAGVFSNPQAMITSFLLQLADRSSSSMTSSTDSATNTENDIHDINSNTTAYHQIDNDTYDYNRNNINKNDGGLSSLTDEKTRMLYALVIAPVLPQLLDRLWNVVHAACKAGKHVGSDAIKHGRVLSTELLVNIVQFLKGSDAKKPSKADVLLTDGFLADSKEARALMWYMMQPGNSVVTRLEKVESVMMPNPEQWTRVAIPSHWTSTLPETGGHVMECKVEHAVIDDAHLPTSERPREAGGGSGGGIPGQGGNGNNNGEGSVRVRKAFRVHVSCTNTDANTLVRLVRDVQRMYNDSSKGFDYEKQQIFEVRRSSTSGGLNFLEGVEFNSNVRVDNTFLDEDVERLISTRLTMFNSREEHAALGLPRKLSMLLYGPPGTGKTSIIKAMANLTRRNIIRVNLSLIKSRQELMALFHPDRMYVQLTDFGTDSIFMPMDTRMYVFEEIDEQSPVVLCRKGMTPVDENTLAIKASSGGEDDLEKIRNGVIDAEKTLDENSSRRLELLRHEVRRLRIEAEQQCPEALKNRKRNELLSGFNNTIAEHNNRVNVDTDDQKRGLSLGDVLEALDGLVEMDGRLIIFTTNRLEALDPALVRPGRMDVKVRLGEMGESALLRMARRFFGDEAAEDVFRPFARALHKQLTPAEVGGCMMESKSDDGQRASAHAAARRLMRMREKKRQAWIDKTNAHTRELEGFQEGLERVISLQRAFTEAVTSNDAEARQRILSVLVPEQVNEDNEKVKNDIKNKRAHKNRNKKSNRRRGSDDDDEDSNGESSSWSDDMS